MLMHKCTNKKREQIVKDWRDERRRRKIRFGFISSIRESVQLCRVLELNKSDMYIIIWLRGIFFFFSNDAQQILTMIEMLNKNRKSISKSTFDFFPSALNSFLHLLITMSLIFYIFNYAKEEKEEEKSSMEGFFYDAHGSFFMHF